MLLHYARMEHAYLIFTLLLLNVGEVRYYYSCLIVLYVKHCHYEKHYYFFHARNILTTILYTRVIVLFTTCAYA